MAEDLLASAADDVHVAEDLLPPAADDVHLGAKPRVLAAPGLLNISFYKLLFKCVCFHFVKKLH